MILAATTLTTDRLTLRQPDYRDLAPYTAYCTSDRSRFTGGPFDAVQAFDKLAAMIGHWTLRGFGRYTIMLGEQSIGHVGPLAMDDSHAPEMTWTLWDPAAEGHGYATEAARRVQAHLFDDLGWTDLIIRILPDNHGSRAIAERVGARLTDEPAPAWLEGALTYRVEAAA